MGEGSRIDLRGFTAGVDVEKVREKALLFLRKHEEDRDIHKLKWNEPLTSAINCTAQHCIWCKTPVYGVPSAPVSMQPVIRGEPAYRQARGEHIGRPGLDRCRLGTQRCLVTRF